MRKRVFAGILVLLFVIVIGNAFAEDWFMFGHDMRHSRVYMADDVPARGDLTWTDDVTQRFLDAGAPGGTVTPIKSSPAIDENGTIYVTVNDFTLWLFNMNAGGVLAYHPNGSLKWFSNLYNDQRILPFGIDRVSSPLVHDGKVYVGTGGPTAAPAGVATPPFYPGGGLTILDASDGSFLSNSPGGPKGEPIAVSPVLFHDMIYTFTFENHYLNVHDLDGNLAFQCQIKDALAGEDIKYIVSSPAIGENIEVKNASDEPEEMNIIYVGMIMQLDLTKTNEPDENITGLNTGGGTVLPLPCFDSTKNQDETDVDCGGLICADRCDEGQTCLVNGDCASGLKCSFLTVGGGAKKCAKTVITNGVITNGVTPIFSAPSSGISSPTGMMSAQFQGGGGTGPRYPWYSGPGTPNPNMYGVVYAIDAEWWITSGDDGVDDVAVGDTDDCDVIWRFVTWDPIVSSPTVEGDAVHIASSYYTYSFDAGGQWDMDGDIGYVDPAPAMQAFFGGYDIDWRMANGNTPRLAPATIGTQSSPAAKTNFYIGTEGELGSIQPGLKNDMTKADYIWAYNDPSGAVYHSSPSVANGRVYIGESSTTAGATQQLAILNFTNGNLLTTAALNSMGPSARVWSSPAIAQGLVAIGDDTGTLTVLTGADFEAHGITFNDTVAFGELVTITGDVRELSGIRGGNVIITLNSSERGLLKNQTVYLPAGGSTTISHSWRASPAGKHNFTLSVFSTEGMGDYNIDNNVYQKVVDIGTSPGKGPPDLEAVGISLSTDKTNVLVGENVEVTTATKNNGGQTTEDFTVQVLQNNQSYSNFTKSGIAALQTYRKSVAWKPTQEGTYQFTMKVDPADEVNESNENNNEFTLKGITVRTPAGITITPTTLNLGNVSQGGSATGTVAIKNVGNTTVQGLKVNSTVSWIKPTLSSTTLAPGSNVTLTIKANVPLNTDGKTYTSSVSIEGTGLKGKGVSVKVTVPAEEIPTMAIVKGNVQPPEWDMSPTILGQNKTQTFTAGLNTSNVLGVSVSAVPSGDLSSMIVIAPNSAPVNLQTSADFEALFIASGEAGTKTGEINFIFASANGTVYDTVAVPISVKVNEDILGLINSLKLRHASLNSKLQNLQAQAGAGTKFAKLIEGNVSEAQNYLDLASEDIDGAEGAYDAVDFDGAKQLAGSASDNLDRADAVLSRISLQLNSSTKKTGGSMAPLIGALAAIGAFGMLILSLREGWLPAEKVPWLVKGFEKIGLGALVTPPDGIAKHMQKSQAPIKAHTQFTSRAEWEKYYREHPEYARKYKQWYQYARQHPGYARKYAQQYTSNYNRRFR